MGALKYKDSTWIVTWGDKNATLSDLANYLPLSAKPTGTYTGNGDATRRVINIGGIGKVLHIVGNGFGVFVDGNGATIHSSNGGTITTLPSNEVYFSDGDLVLATTNGAVNATAEYYWDLL